MSAEGPERQGKAPRKSRVVRLIGTPNFKSMRTAEDDDVRDTKHGDGLHKDGHETWRRTPQRKKEPTKTGKGGKGTDRQRQERRGKAPRKSRAVGLSGAPNFKSMRTAKDDDMRI